MPYAKEFLEAYIECALWSSNDQADESGGEPLDANYSAEDISEETLLAMRGECAQFLWRARKLLRASGMDAGQAGHDFWLTRCGHGAGFWDRGLGKVGDALTERSETFGNVDLYIGDDGHIYGS